MALRMCSSSDGKKPSQAATIAKTESKDRKASDPPAGFEAFFEPSVTRNIAMPDTPGAAVHEALTLSSSEQALCSHVEQVLKRKKLTRRAMFFCFVVASYLGYSSYRRSELLAAEVSAYEFVVVDLSSHLASFYNAAGKSVAARYFIDFLSLESSVDDQKNIIVNYGIHYPLAPMLLLLLLPFLSSVNNGFQGTATAAAREAVQGISQKSRFRFKKDMQVKTRLADVAGLTEAKLEVIEVIDFLKNPQAYQKLGARLPKGVLLDGPPGVGKTLLAKAVAGEAMVPFVSCSGSEFEEVYVGVGAQRVRELFKQAHQSKPCVVFIDEIDTFGRKRKSDSGGHSRGTINAFLSELDGFHDATGIIVLAATNRSDVLDPALTRSGRFDRKITLEKPPHKDRVAIALVHLKPLRLDPNTSIEAFAEVVASLTAGCSGADIYNICNEAAIFACREERDFVNVEHFHKALERVLIGLEKQAVKLAPREKERIAHHEAGIVVLGWYLGLTDPTIKTTIVPRGASNTGSTQTLPSNVYISTQERLLQNMIRRLGGYVTEEHFFKDVSSIAAEDLRRVTNLAQDIICTYGMDPKGIGHFGFEVDRSDAIQKPFGPIKENNIDDAISRLVDDCLSKARMLLKEKIEQVRIVSGLLLKQETLSAQELWLVLGDRPIMTPEFRKFLES
jgi:AFG3 family protein